ncbi:hypothetical protein BKP45_21165 [Anaerobacillus alkalidiazotrophicus]|uniref:TIGR02679 family protein n=1 Tax=Anaerobacillus alkalidiazotrophicus TaxID=472963 RepID=A0A1S2LVH8_9BACI|nr:DUF2399 domain-containing protein [Anaerobacillus alkalidiazotrophicus]OIJ16518.1 hypothetical protein BKP45_21165 [Anaerobacillus alkalidiazotrophicus]
MDSLLKFEAKHYFGKKEFKRLFQLFKEKIESLGKVGGTVTFEPTPDERMAIERWLDKEFTRKSITVNLENFEGRLKGLKFEEFTLWELVELVTEKRIIPKKEREKQQLSEKQSFFEGLEKEFEHSYTNILLKKIRNKDRDVTWITTLYNCGDYQTIKTLFRALTSLPSVEEFERLPVFSERITGDPHYFDNIDRLCNVLEIIQAYKEERFYRSNLLSEEKEALLEAYGLAKDDLHNFVTCYGLEASRDGQIVQQWHWANLEKTVQNIPLRSMKRLDSISPVIGNAVYVIENSGVYSSVIDRLEGSLAPLICTHGNFKLSGLLLLDKVVKNGCKIYYSGDFDANGVAFAYFLRRRYGHSVQFWRMGYEDYIDSISPISLTERAIKRLTSINDIDLLPAINEMVNRKKAGYQEALLKKLVDDVILYSKEN